MTISTWSPERAEIANITNANPGVVTTTEENGYLDGLYVRLVLPANFGMQQVNSNIYLITVLSPTTFSINADTTSFDTFALGSSLQTPQVIPVGEVALTLANRERNTLTPVGGTN